MSFEIDSIDTSKLTDPEKPQVTVNATITATDADGNPVSYAKTLVFAQSQNYVQMVNGPITSDLINATLTKLDSSLQALHDTAKVVNAAVATAKASQTIPVIPAVSL